MTFTKSELEEVLDGCVFRSFHPIRIPKGCEIFLSHNGPFCALDIAQIFRKLGVLRVKKELFSNPVVFFKKQSDERVLPTLVGELNIMIFREAYFQHFNTTERFENYHLGNTPHGDIFVVKDNVLGKECVRKTVLRRKNGTTEKRKKFIEQIKHEVHICKYLSSFEDCPLHIAKFHNSSCTKESYTLEMEYAARGSLASRVKSRRRKEREVNRHIARCQKWFRQIMDGVFYLHSKNVSHRDLNIENILLSEGNDVRIFNFGQSVRCDDSWMKKGFCGNSSNYAPETKWDKEYDCRAVDIYCCGKILYQMIVGDHPHEKKDYNTKLEILSGNLREVVNTEMEKQMILQPERHMRLKHFPEEALDLCQKMLQPSKTRITEEEIKEHPYYNGGSKEHTSTLDPPQSDVKLNVDAFLTRCNLNDSEMASNLGIEPEQLVHMENFVEEWRFKNSEMDIDCLCGDFCDEFGSEKSTDELKELLGNIFGDLEVLIEFGNMRLNDDEVAGATKNIDTQTKKETITPPPPPIREMAGVCLEENTFEPMNDIMSQSEDLYDLRDDPENDTSKPGCKCQCPIM